MSTETSSPAEPVASTPTSTGSTSALQAIEKAHASVSSTETASATPNAASLGSPETPNSAATSALATDGTLPRSPGEAPESRIQAAVRNARDQAEKELGWAREYGDQTEVKDAMARWRYLRQDPQKFARELAKELGLTVVERTQGPEQDLSDPEPDLQAEDRTPAYSARTIKILIDNALKRQAKELEVRYQPALQYTEDQKQQAAQAQLHAQSKEFATRALAEVSKLPHFDKAGVHRAYVALTPQQQSEMGSYGSLMTAYTNYLTREVLPTLNEQSQTKAIEDLKRSAVAGSPSAASTVPAAPSKASLKDGDLTGLAAHMEKIYGAMSVT